MQIAHTLLYMIGIPTIGLMFPQHRVQVVTTSIRHEEGTNMRFCFRAESLRYCLEIFAWILYHFITRLYIKYYIFY